MDEHFYSVEQVAERLGLHVRTVRNYVRDGQLAAVRIGKQYRIADADLAAFLGRAVPAPVRETVVREQHAEVSSIVQIDAISAATADRVTTLLMGAAADRSPRERLRIDTVYDAERGRLKVIVLGGLGETARLFEYMEAVLAS